MLVLAKSDPQLLKKKAFVDTKQTNKQTEKKKTPGLKRYLEDKLPV